MQNKGHKGFTLIELAVVLAIIAVLAAILTPIVTNYLDQARVSRAMADTKTIADAIRLYRRDTGFYPIYASLNAARLGTTVAASLVSPGLVPTNNNADWTPVLSTTASLITQLNTVLSGLSTNDNNPGKASYRGPYIGALDSDAWGNEYVVTANNLEAPLTGRSWYPLAPTANSRRLLPRAQRRSQQGATMSQAPSTNLFRSLQEEGNYDFKIKGFHTYRTDGRSRHHCRSPRPS